MEMRPLNQADLSQARQLWETCFSDHPAFLDWYFQTRFQPEDGLGIFLDHRLRCHLHLAPRLIKIRKQIYPTAYLIALATDPPFRGFGLAKKLLTYALRHLAARRRFFTFLLPFDSAFYTRLGWGVYADHRQYLLPAGSSLTATLAKYFPAQYGLDSCETGSEEKLLARIYNQWSKQWDGTLVRTAQDWSCLLLEHKLDHGCLWMAATNPAAEPEGYALVLPPSPATQGRPLLRELVYPGSHQTSGLAQLTPYLPPGTDAQFLGRITNIQLALGALPYPPLAIELVLEVSDPLLPENSGKYLLNLTEGKMQVKRTKGDKTSLHCTIGALAALAIGGIHPQKLVSAGEITLGDTDLVPVLAALFPATNTFVNEYF